MNILIKMILLPAAIINISNCSCSTKKYISDSLLVNISSNSNTDSSGLFPNIPCENSLFSINKISHNNNKIYNPNISNLVKMKYTNANQITNNKKYINNKYLDLQNNLNSCANDINSFYNNILLIEQEWNNNKNLQRNNIEEYVTNALQSTINYQNNVINNINTIKTQLIDIYSSATVSNIENTIEKYTDVADALLEYESNNIKLQGESYIDRFKFKIKKLYFDYAQYKNKSPEIFKKLIFANFYAAHENLINMINTKIKKTQNKLSNIINGTVKTIRNSNSFLFISDENSCIVSKLIDKIDEIKCNINDNCKLINANIICIQNPDINIEEQKLKYRKNLITKHVKKLIEILNKQILFNSNDENLIINTRNIINNMKSRLQYYIND